MSRAQYFTCSFFSLLEKLDLKKTQRASQVKYDSLPPIGKDISTIDDSSQQPISGQCQCSIDQSEAVAWS